MILTCRNRLCYAYYEVNPRQDFVQLHSCGEKVRAGIGALGEKESYQELVRKDKYVLVKAVPPYRIPTPTF